MSKIEAILFDYDDTLCMTEYDCYLIENAALAEMGRSPMSREIHKTTWGRPLLDAMTDRSPGVDVDKFETNLLRIHREWIREGKIDVVPDEYLMLLRHLGSMGIVVGILTSRKENEVLHMLEDDHPLDVVLDVFYHSDSTKVRKPDPAVFDPFFVDYPHINREHTVYVGDSPTDAEAAVYAGLGKVIISLESGLRTKADFAQFETKIDFVTNLKEVENIIKAA